MVKNVKDTFVPEYWKSTLAEVKETMDLVKKGKTSIKGYSAGGRPLYFVEYGESCLPAPKASLSGALGSRDYKNFADKTSPDYVPTVCLMGAVHGGEWEGTVALNNLIKIIETGTDYKGDRHDELRELCSKVHLLIMPLCNPDGRERIPFKNFVGKTFEDLRYYNQGTWKNGELCGWPNCMKYHGINEYCNVVGGYFNDNGVNFNNDNFFVDPQPETKTILRLAQDYIPDISIMLHGGDNTKGMFNPPRHTPNVSYVSMALLGAYVKEKSAEAGYEFGYMDYKIGERESNRRTPSFGISSAYTHTCGEPCFIYESNQGLTEHPSGSLGQTNEEIFNRHMILFKSVIEWILEIKSPMTAYMEERI